MIHISEPGTVLLYDGKLARVVGIAEGRTIIMRFIQEPECPTCGCPPGASVLEQSPAFQDHAAPVVTIR